MSYSQSDCMTMVISPTRVCNRNCAYCYVKERNQVFDRQKSVMSKATVEETFEKADQAYPNYRVLWHGGEPSLAGPEFFEHAVKVQKPETKNSVQTNGHCSEETLQVWKDLDFSLSTSLDLPLAANQVTRSESPKQALRRLARLQAVYPKTGVVSTITRHNVKRPWLILPMARRIGWKANPVFFQTELAPTLDDFTLFLKWWMKRLLVDPACKMASPFREYIQQLFTGETRTCTFSKDCQENFVAVGPEGDIYPCNRVVGNKDYSYGNVRDGFEVIERSPLRQLFRQRAEALKESDCSSCEWFSVCHGGCPAESGPFKPDPYCKSFLETRNYLRELLVGEGVVFEGTKATVVPSAVYERFPGLRALTKEPSPFGAASFGSHDQYEDRYDDSCFT